MPLRRDHAARLHNGVPQDRELVGSARCHGLGGCRHRATFPEVEVVSDWRRPYPDPHSKPCQFGWGAAQVGSGHGTRDGLGIRGANCRCRAVALLRRNVPEPRFGRAAGRATRPHASEPTDHLAAVGGAGRHPPGRPLLEQPRLGVGQCPHADQSCGGHGAATSPRAQIACSDPGPPESVVGGIDGWLRRHVSRYASTSSRSRRRSCRLALACAAPRSVAGTSPRAAELGAPKGGTALARTRMGVCLSYRRSAQPELGLSRVEGASEGCWRPRRPAARRPPYGRHRAPGPGSTRAHGDVDHGVVEHVDGGSLSTRDRPDPARCCWSSWKPALGRERR